MKRHPDNDEAIRRGQLCPYCMKDTVYIKSSAGVYHGRDYGPLHICWDCRAWVGVHHGGRRALGRVANAELRAAKSLAHKSFDALWKRKVQRGIMKDAGLSHGRNYKCWKNACRNKAYQWLSEAMGIPKHQTHIGMFDIEQCKRVVALCEPYLIRKPQFA